MFVTISKKLNLFYHKGGTRPLYSIRHTYATELYKKGTAMDDIAELMNTSARMVMNVYLGHTDSALINLAKRVPSKLKRVKWWIHLLNCFGIGFWKWWIVMNVISISQINIGVLETSMRM